MNKIPNPKRGCGHLKENAMYVRADISSFGVLPPFVAFKKPIPFLEQHFRTYKMFNGIQWQIAMGNRVIEDIPEEFDEHLSRIKDSEGAMHLGEMKTAWATDLLMWIGENYYSKPEEFIQECRAYGLNKRIPNHEPPLIIPGITRLFLVHPRAINGKEAGIIGYSYLTRVVYTKKGNSPEWINNLEKLGRIEYVEIDTVFEDKPQKKLLEEENDE